MCLCVFLLCVCVCVRERERERVLLSRLTQFVPSLVTLMCTLLVLLEKLSSQFLNVTVL